MVKGGRKTAGKQTTVTSAAQDVIKQSRRVLTVAGSEPTASSSEEENEEENSPGPSTVPERESIDTNLTEGAESSSVKERAAKYMDKRSPITKDSTDTATTSMPPIETSSTTTPPDFTTLTNQMVELITHIKALDAKFDHIDGKLEEVKKAIDTQSKRITTVENKVTEITLAVKAHEGGMTEITLAVKAHEGGMTEMEKDMERVKEEYRGEIQMLKNEATERQLESQRYHRRNNIRIVGLDEAVICEDANFPTVLSKILGNNDPNTVLEVDQVYRIGSRGLRSSGPRVIIVTLRKTTTRDDIIKYARNQRGKLNYGDKSIFIYEDLSKEAIIRRLPYKDVMQKLFKSGHKPRLSYPALLTFVGNDGIRSGAHTPEEAEVFLKRNEANNPRQDDNAGNR